MYGQNNYYQPYQGYYPPNGGAVPDVLSQFKAGYQQQPIQNGPVQNMPPPVQSDMLWVLNETEATGYPVAPNNNVILWDKNRDTVYIKSVNTQGVPSMRILDYVERSENAEKSQNGSDKHECGCTGKFVPMETYNALVEQIDLLRAKVEAMALQLKPKKNKEDVDNG